MNYEEEIMDLESRYITIGVLFLTAFTLGATLGAGSVQSPWRLDAASTECAQFDPANGQFEWIKDSKE
jgi:hypothetical protein